MERFAKLAAQILNPFLDSPISWTDLEIPPEPKLGDFAFPCFKLAKQLKKAPPHIAQQLVNQIHQANPSSEQLQVHAVGPYVNFTVPPQTLLKTLLKDILEGPHTGVYGSLPAQTRGTWVLEYSSPNVAKPLNIYHLRPTALGAALDRIGRYRGYHVISINHLGDWGKQYGMLTVAFRIFGKTLQSDLSMLDLVDLYVKVNALAEKDPQIEEEAKQAFVRLEKGDPEITALWRKCVDISLQEFHRNYARLGVKFDHIWGESYYKDQLPPLLEHLKKQKILVESDGAWIVEVTDPEGKELPPCLLQKSDGATIYATRDVAAAIYRHKQFQFDRMTYIVGAEQRLHFQQVFGVLKRLGLDWVQKCEHVPFGLYRFKDAKMSTRKGNFITLDEVLAQAKDRVKTLMQERAKAKREDSSETEKTQVDLIEQVAEAVAIGAVVFHDLHTDPVRDVEFDLAKVVDFEGETGPYLQYAHTRCLSILRKAQATAEAPATIGYSDALTPWITSEVEIRLVQVLGQFPIHLERTLTFAKASQLAHYLIEVTQAFGAFYRECQVLGQAREVTQARLMLVEATRRVLAQGLMLLGIPIPQRM